MAIFSQKPKDDVKEEEEWKQHQQKLNEENHKSYCMYLSRNIFGTQTEQAGKRHQSLQISVFHFM